MMVRSSLVGSNRNFFTFVFNPLFAQWGQYLERSKEMTLKLKRMKELDDGFVTWEDSTGQAVGYKPSSSISL